MKKNKSISALKRELGESLAAYRLSRNLRQEDVAVEAGVSPGVVVRIEAGKGGTVDSLARIVKALGWEDRLAALVPDAAVSPLDPRSAKSSRKRARKPAGKGKSGEPWTWGE